MTTSNRPRKNSRRKLGGTIWNNRIDDIRQAVVIINTAIREANEVMTEIVHLVREKKNIPFMGVVSVYVLGMSHRLTKIQNAASVILTAIEEIDNIAQDAVKQQKDEDADLPET